MTLAPFASRQRRVLGQRVITPAVLLDPYREMEEINSRFSQLIQSFFRDTPAMPATGAGGWSNLPAVDIEETDEAYIIDVDMPNVNPDDVNLEMRGEELHISGRTLERDRSGVMRRQNRPTGEFEWLVDLPSDIDANHIDATYDSGVLTISVGKAPDVAPRRIAIHVAHAEGNGGAKAAP